MKYMLIPIGISQVNECVMITHKKPMRLEIEIVFLTQQAFLHRRTNSENESLDDVLITVQF